ncbi:hypothetical protein PHISP_00522 [Aspergillus sp. HF37]|nr:hypothetical protein PHISP_00522 [Aspergillus sp. HF37]
MGVTLGEYVAEFEKVVAAAGEGEAGSASVCEGEGEDEGEGLGLQPPVETLDFANFDLDEWFWTDEFLGDG